MNEKIDLTSLLALTSERVSANSQDRNLLPADDLPGVIKGIEQFLRHAQPGDPLPSEVRDLPSVQLLQILFEMQNKNI